MYVYNKKTKKTNPLSIDNIGNDILLSFKIFYLSKIWSIIYQI